MDDHSETGEGSKVWQVEVIELRRVPVTYHVVADTVKEAEQLALKGDTILEMDEGLGEVQERFVDEIPVLLEELSKACDLED